MTLATALTTETQRIEAGPAFAQAGLVHRVRVPHSVGPHRTAVLLHGRAGNEDVMWVFARAIPADWLIVAPRAITPDPDGGYAWHPRKRDEWPNLSMFAAGVTTLHRFVQALPSLYGADLSQLYLMGFSQGAALAYAFALQYPALVKGVAGLVGFVPTNTEAANAPLSGLPIHVSIGTQDETIPLPIARQSADILRRAGAELDYHEYATGHKLNSDGMRDLKQWWTSLLEQNR